MDEGFHTTRWTRVLAARGGAPDAKVALSELCEIYYGPVFRFVRHMVRGGDSDAAQDLTQGFFEALLEGGGIRGLKKGRGKFRSYLLGAVKHFLADRRKWDMAEKRGGEVLVPDGESAQSAEGDGVSDAYFDREWALALLGRALDRVAEEHGGSENTEQFEVLKPWLNGDAAGVSQADAASALGISEGAVKVAIHRMRKRLRAAVRREILQTVETEGEVAGELEYLIEALG